jgi:hypothetical protein
MRRRCHTCRLKPLAIFCQHLVLSRLKLRWAPDAGLSFILRSRKCQETKLCLIIATLPVSNTGSFTYKESTETIGIKE